MSTTTIDTGKVQATLIQAPIPGGAGLVEITSGRKTATYTIAEIGHCDAGFSAYRLLEQGRPADECYDVEIGPCGYRRCDCRGHEAHGHCKHAETVRALITRGALPDPAPVADDDLDPFAHSNADIPW